MIPPAPGAPLDNRGDRIRYAREFRGMSQRQLARAIHREETLINKIETGQISVILPETINRLVRVLDLKVLWLETGDPELAPVPWPKPRRHKRREPQPQLAEEAIKLNLPKHVPLAIARMLCRGTVGPVSDVELNELIRYYNVNAFRGASFVRENTLELELWAIRFARAESGLAKVEIADAFSAAVSRMRAEVEVPSETSHGRAGP